MEKVTLAQLRARLRQLKDDEGLAVWLCPSKCYPNIGHPFNMAIRVMFNNEGFRINSPDAAINDITLQQTVDAFHYYNCNSETGNYVHYYIEA